MQMSIQGYSEHNDKVSHHACQVEQKGENKKEKLDLPWVSESQEHKLRHSRVIPSIHGSGQLGYHEMMGTKNVRKKLWLSGMIVVLNIYAALQMRTSW